VGFTYQRAAMLDLMMMYLAELLMAAQRKMPALLPLGEEEGFSPSSTCETSQNGVRREGVGKEGRLAVVCRPRWTANEGGAPKKSHRSFCEHGS